LTPGFSDSVICPNCNAANPASSEICRRCDLPLPPPTAGSEAGSRRDAVKRIKPEPAHVTQFTLSSLLICLTVIATIFGISGRAPGLGIAIALFCLPAFIRTARLIRRREQLGRPTSTTQKVFTFVGSIVFAWVASAVVLVASVGTFCTICITGANMNMGDEILLVSIVAAIAVTLLAAIGLHKFSSSRWDREIDRD
jgi:hypothetical protein